MRFRLGKIPVTVQPSFFVATLVLGASAGDPRMVAAWIAIVFVSVMLHELGHASAGLAFGLEPQIELHTMGGTTSWTTARTLSTAQRVTISLAGPFAGFVVAAIAAAAHAAAGPRGLAAGPDVAGAFVYETVLFVNLWWGLANLVPMLPLDGGNVMTHLLNALTGGRGERPARIVSIAVAGIALAAVLLLPLVGVATPFSGLWATMLALLFASSNWNALRELDAREQRGGT
jgi:Zn-dependent protease